VLSSEGLAPIWLYAGVADMRKSFDGFVTSTAAKVATRPGRPLPGRDSHPLEHSALSRHTRGATLRRFVLL